MEDLEVALLITLQFRNGEPQRIGWGRLGGIV